MGYTHYWRKSEGFTPEQFTKLGEATRKVIATWEETTGGKIVQEYDETGKPPHITGELIMFNGPGKEGHETFYLLAQPEAFEFCKTDRKPYDDVVTAILILAEHYAPQAILISSDGDPEEWAAGLALARTVEEKARLPFKEAAA